MGCCTTTDDYQNTIDCSSLMADNDIQEKTKKQKEQLDCKTWGDVYKLVLSNDTSKLKFFLNYYFLIEQAFRSISHSGEHQIPRDLRFMIFIILYSLPTRDDSFETPEEYRSSFVHMICQNILPSKSSSDKDIISPIVVVHSVKDLEDSDGLHSCLVQILNSHDCIRYVLHDINITCCITPFDQYGPCFNYYLIKNLRKSDYAFVDGTKFKEIMENRLELFKLNWDIALDNALIMDRAVLLYRCIRKESRKFRGICFFKTSLNPLTLIYMSLRKKFYLPCVLPCSIYAATQVCPQTNRKNEIHNPNTILRIDTTDDTTNTCYYNDLCYINLYSYFVLESIILENDHVIVSLKMMPNIEDIDHYPYELKYLKGGGTGRYRFVEAHVLMERFLKIQEYMNLNKK
jgi:hypothetical protein